MNPDKFRQLIRQHAEIKSAQQDHYNDPDPDPDHAIQILHYRPGQHACEYCDRMLPEPPRRVLQYRDGTWVERCVPCQNTVEKTATGYQFRRSTGRQKKSTADDWVQTGGTEEL